MKDSNLVTIKPKKYQQGLRNPLKGFQDDIDHPYATLVPFRIPWSMLEQSADDGVERIIQVSDNLWGNYPEHNAKVVPRVYLHWDTDSQDPDGDSFYWSDDLKTGDYSSPKFKARLKSMIAKLGKAWENDPRVAYVEMGIIGKWGEQHSPEISPQLQKLMGDAFVKAFPNTPVMHRYPEDFTDYDQFGLHWDSWGHPEEFIYHVPYFESQPWKDRWKTLPIGGETAFDWGTPLGESPTDAVVNNHEYIIELIERWHTNHLSWLSNYDQNNPVARANASEIQKAFGYRFEIESVTYPTSVKSGEKFDFSFEVNNSGNTPLYGDWSVELAFHDLDTREVVWQTILPNIKTSKWLPNRTKNITRSIDLPDSVKSGKYAISLSILDPASNDPAVKFATKNYWNGGRHPLGKIGVDKNIQNPTLHDFDDPGKDDSLYYVAEPELSLSKTEIDISISANETLNYSFSLGNQGNRPLSWRIVTDSLEPRPISILLVDDDGNQPNVRNHYKKALNNLDYEYDVFNVQTGGGNGPSFNKLSQYDLVVWFSGDLYSDDKPSAGPNQRDERRLGRYLDRGGKLLLSSQEYAYDLGQEVNDFMRDYLGVEDVWSDFGQKTSSLNGETVISGLSDIDLKPVGDVYHDALFPRSGQTIFSDSDTDYGQAIATSDTAYLAFPWENIYNADPLTGEKVMDSLIDYLLPQELPWLSLDKTKGGIGVNNSQTIKLGFDSRGYQTGDVLKADLEVWSNDIERSPLSIPVTLNINN